MPIVFDRYEPDHKSIGEFLLSDQLRDAVRQGAEDIASLANNTAGITRLRGSYFREPGPPVVVTANGNLRLSERVWSHHQVAAADEFGSGSGNKGKSQGKARKESQGGGSAPFRTLGKAADRIGDRFGEVDD